MRVSFKRMNGKVEPEWMLEWRLSAFRENGWKWERADWALVDYPKIWFPKIRFSYYSAQPKSIESPKKKPLSLLDEVDSWICFVTYEKLGIPLIRATNAGWYRGWMPWFSHFSLSGKNTFLEAKLAEAGRYFLSDFWSYTENTLSLWKNH